MPLRPEAGGTERITSLVAKGLSMHGHECMDILVFKQDGGVTYHDEPVNDVYKFLKANNVDIVINQIAYSKWLLADFLTKGGDRWHKEGGKIISCLHFDPKPASDLYYFNCIQDKALREYFNLIKAFLLYPYYTKRQERHTGEVFNWVYEHSDWYITLSETHFPYFKKVTQRSDYSRLRAINNPLTFDDIADESILAEKKKVVLVCSRMDEYQKRISFVLKAWKKLQSYPESEGWILKILGTGPDLERYKQYVRRKNIENVIFEGQQSPEPYYREADIFLMTSIGIEGWGLTLTESLQRGVAPVVMNTCSVYSDIILDGYNGFLTHGSDLNDFVKHIRILLNDGRRLKSMQKNALESAQRFTLEKTMEKWKGLFMIPKVNMMTVISIGDIRHQGDGEVECVIYKGDNGRK